MDGPHRVAVFILDVPKRDNVKDMGYALREVAKLEEFFDEVHMHARIIIKPEVLRNRSEAEAKLIIQEKQGHALALLEVCFGKYGAKKASGTVVKYDATVCVEAQLEDYIIGVVSSRGVVIAVLVLGFQIEEARRNGILSSLHAAPGAMLGTSGKSETSLERISRKAQCTVCHVYKDGPKLKQVLYNPPEGEVVDFHGATPPYRPHGLQASRSLPGVGPTSPPLLGHFQPASSSVPPGGHFPQPPLPGGYFPVPQFYHAVVRSPGHTGPVGLPPGYHYVVVSPGHGDPSAPPLHPFPVSPPQFVHPSPGQDSQRWVNSTNGGRSHGPPPTQYQTVPALHPGTSHERASSRELSYECYSIQELTEATNNFSQELGGGGFGTVYLGTLRGTQVAVKKMNPEGLQGPAQFECEVKLLTTLRHRNIVILMGCCPEAFCLVYEYCAQGSLETRLADETRPLPWYTRVRILLETATAVLWMHKHNFLHCDIKLANMLLDESNTAKLGDVGISRMIPSPEARTARLTGTVTGPLRTSSSVRGSFGYVDPALFQGYPLEECSDVYALGVCLLQLLTKRAAGAVKRDVKQAYVSRNMPGVLDRSAGDWPLKTVVEDLTNLGLRCTEFEQENRPDLESEVIPVLSRLNDLGKAAERQGLESLRRAAAEIAALRAPGARPRDNSDIMESQFKCPLSLDIMEDPVVAADGHTYERSLIATWLTNSRISPVTNLPLPNMNLVVNQTVKSAIMEWRQRTGV